MLPEAVAQVVNSLIDRIERTHQLAISIPTTLAGDQAANTSPYVERTLALLGPRFDGATSKQAHGVWHRKMVGLVCEDVYLVQTYATDADLMQYLDEVVAYVRGIKRELQQEAMALEMDQKLILI